MNWNDIFYYKDGELHWISIPKGKMSPGSIAGCIKKDGYVYVGFKNAKIMAHRIIWEMHNGKIPEGMEIDHINHTRDDNRIENLRVVTHSENNRNISKASNNKSGYTGVSYEKTRDKWRSSIQINRKLLNLGSCDRIEDAIKARLDAEIKYDFHKNHGDK